MNPALSISLFAVLIAVGAVLIAARRPQTVIQLTVDPRFAADSTPAQLSAVTPLGLMPIGRSGTPGAN